jgi:hypothetical protein
MNGELIYVIKQDTNPTGLTRQATNTTAKFLECRGSRLWARYPNFNRFSDQLTAFINLLRNVEEQLDLPRRSKPVASQNSDGIARFLERTVHGTQKRGLSATAFSNRRQWKSWSIRLRREREQLN